DNALSSYVRGLAVVCFVMAGLATSGFVLLGLPHPLVLGLVAGACEAVPFVGFIVTSVVVATVGLSQSPWLSLEGFLVYAGLNQFLSYVVTPRVMAARMRLHPLTIILSVMVGAKLAGFVGVVLALPAVSVGRILFLRLVLGRVAVDCGRADSGGTPNLPPAVR
ncbi:MAG: AI-2E family transporter, partial [Candidatus Eisenbacteria bacterium]